MTSRRLYRTRSQIALFSEREKRNLRPWVLYNQHDGNALRHVFVYLFLFLSSNPMRQL